MRQSFNTYFLILACFALLTAQSCGDVSEKDERLAKKYCSSCHSFPDPSLLDKETWAKGVLPEMAFRMGLDYSGLGAVPENDLPAVVRSLPPNPMITKEEWERITNYFLQAAPDSLPVQPLTVADTTLPFHVKKVTLAAEQQAMGTLISFDSLRNTVYYGTRNSLLYRLTNNLSVIDVRSLDSPPSELIYHKNRFSLLTMGIMDPNDQSAGKITSVDPAGKSTLIYDSLQRPVSFSITDLNNDGLDDYVVCAFGHFTGGLLALEQKKDGTFKQHILQHVPGARRVIVKDFDSNGLPDILALMAQGDERIILLYNQGNFRFRIKTLLRFPPVYGSSYFEIHDFNGDGKFDILYSNGDNGDYSAVLKPYHGVRIFLNDGTNRFNEDWFHPMNGASKVIARDFDNDGDLDIAAISFFPDFNSPEQGFIYFQNDSGRYTPKTTQQAASGRWLLMETMDLNNDGSTDLVLGALNFPTGVPMNLFNQWRDTPVNLLVLQGAMQAHQ